MITDDINTICEQIQNLNYRLILSVDGSCSTADENLCSFTEYINDSLHDFCMKRLVNDSGQYDNMIIVDDVQYHKVNNGVNVLVFDKKTETVADMFGIDIDAGYSIVK